MRDFLSMADPSDLEQSGKVYRGRPGESDPLSGVVYRGLAVARPASDVLVGNFEIAAKNESIQASAFVVSQKAQESQPPVEPLPERPFSVSKLTSFPVATSDPVCIFDKLDVVMRKISGDFTIDCQRQKTNLSGIVYQNCRGSKFAVNLFRDPKGALVEFQRISGSHVAFAQMYRKIVNAYNDMPELDDFGILDEEESLDTAPQEHLASLVEYGNSGYYEQVLEATTSLACCSSSLPSARALGELLKGQSPLMQLISQSLKSQDEELSHAGCALVANLSEVDQGRLCADLLQCLAPMSKLLVAPTSTWNLDTKRKVSIAFKNIAAKHPEQLKEYQKHIKIYSGANDAVIKENCLAALKSVDVKK